jgi:hypothetical protein
MEPADLGDGAKPAAGRRLDVSGGLLVAIAKEVGSPGVVRERLNELLGRPVCGGVLGHVEVDHTRRWRASTMRTKSTPSPFLAR